MSTRVGTLRGSQAGRSIWPAAILASLVMLTIAVAAVSLGRDQAPQTAQRDGTQQNRQAVVGGTAANTPSELSGGSTGNTPSELTGGMFERYGRHQRI